jgi:SAM-dependent methyltransferase
MQEQEHIVQRVKDANRRLYDAVADRYEAVDGRRSPEMEAWVRATLADLARRAPQPSLLDLGTGSGLIPRCATDLYSLRAGVDISPRILALNREVFDIAAAADVDGLPFPDNSFGVITCFAALHHLPTFEGLVTEVARILAPGGLFYSDHDMDEAFYRRFRLPLGVYRRLHDARAAYQKASPQITGELYDDAEWHQKGIPSRHLLALLEGAGLGVETRYHWYGLNPATDRLFGDNPRGRGWAPLISVVATKPPTG